MFHEIIIFLARIINGILKKRLSLSIIKELIIFNLILMKTLIITCDFDNIIFLIFKNL